MPRSTEHLSRLLRQQRLRLGLSLEETARRAGVDVAGLSRSENGKKIPQPETLAALAVTLELPLADLYEAAGYPLPEQLPTLRPYLRRAYNVPDAAVDEIESYLRRLAEQYGGETPLLDGEDELLN